MKSKLYSKDAISASNALLTKDVYKLNKIRNHLSSLISTNQDNKDSEPDPISIIEFIDYGVLLIEHGFTETINNKKVKIKFSLDEAQKLIEKWFPENKL